MKKVFLLAAIACGISLYFTSCTEDELQPENPEIYQAADKPEEDIPERTGYYVDLDRKEYEVGCEGGTVSIAFSTNVPKENLNISVSGAAWMVGASDLVVVSGNDNNESNDNTSSGIAGIGNHGPDKYQPETVEETDYELTVVIESNSTVMALTARIIFSAGRFMQYETLNAVEVILQGAETYESEDYSADGLTVVLHEAEKGAGIPIVLMGDGFTDTEIADGTYSTVMETAMENLFTEEPLKSLRDYFDVYSVTAVSKHGRFGMGYSTALGCELEGNGSTGISGDDNAIMEYVSKIDGLEVSEALAVVVLNTEEYAGTTYFGYSYNGDMTEFAIAYCPTIYGLQSEEFREVLVHEAVGHGFAKLQDEYSYEGVIPAYEKEQIIYMQEEYGWAQNVDFTDDEEAVLWSGFLADSSYEDEDLGIYEGACTYMFGAYRPSEDSMMNSNTLGFNAPSRKSIYDKVMLRGEGREPDYDEFVEFDKTVQTSDSRTVSSSVTRSTSSARHFASPRMAGRSID